MNFGFSPSDIVTLCTLALSAYKGWGRACGEYSDITASLHLLLLNLQQIRAEAGKPDSVLARTAKARDTLEDVVSTCEPTVRKLRDVIAKYPSLGRSRQRNWERLCFGVKNLNDLRTKLTSHVTSVTLYLNTLGLGAITELQRDIRALPERIQRSIDELAEEIRAGRREGSILTTYGDDNKQDWKQFRRELIGEGIDSRLIRQHKP